MKGDTYDYPRRNQVLVLQHDYFILVHLLSAPPQEVPSADGLPCLAPIGVDYLMSVLRCLMLMFNQASPVKQ